MIMTHRGTEEQGDSGKAREHSRQENCGASTGRRDSHRGSKMHILWNEEKICFLEKHMELLKDKELRPGVDSSLDAGEQLFH